MRGTGTGAGHGFIEVGNSLYQSDYKVGTYRYLNLTKAGLVQP